MSGIPAMDKESTPGYPVQDHCYIKLYIIEIVYDYRRELKINPQSLAGKILHAAIYYWHHWASVSNMLADVKSGFKPNHRLLPAGTMLPYIGMDEEQLTILLRIISMAVVDLNQTCNRYKIKEDYR